MKREEVKAIFPDATAEQLKSIMDLNGADIEKEKAKAAEIEAAAAEQKKLLDQLNAEIDSLKANSASVDEWKQKFEDLQKDYAEKEAAAKAEAEAKARESRITARFDAVLGDKKFRHEAIRKDYLSKFAEALKSDDNAGKSDADILHELTKDDPAAFEGVNAVKLAGGRSTVSTAPKTREEILAIKDGTERRAAMADALAADPHFFDEGE